MTDRRDFLKRIPVVCIGVVFAPLALAGPIRLKESAPNALALGYRLNAKSVDKARWPRYQSGQACSNCILYQAKPGVAFGGCPIFGDQQVAAAGWCNSYSRKV